MHTRKKGRKKTDRRKGTNKGRGKVSKASQDLKKGDGADNLWKLVGFFKGLKTGSM